MRKILTLIFLLAVAAGLQASGVVFPSRFDDIIASASEKYDVDPALVKAVIYRESRFQPNAKGTRGEIGLMQLRKSVVKDWVKAHSYGHQPTEEELFDPYMNIMIGVWRLGVAIKRWRGRSTSIGLALFDYNAGKSCVATWIVHYDGDTKAVIDRGPSAAYIREIMGNFAAASSGKGLK